MQRDGWSHEAVRKPRDTLDYEDIFIVLQIRKQLHR